MKVLIRKTLTGAEYWDTEAKKTLFVPVGEKPDFDVTKDPETMIGGVDLVSGKDMTAIDGKVVDEPEFDLDDMNTEDLLEFAKENGVEVPGNMKKEGTIRKYVATKLAELIK